jgi:GTP-binding protein EngB required for normal cell division
VQFIIVRTKMDKVNGRKVNVSGSMETLDGQKLAEAT